MQTQCPFVNSFRKQSHLFSGLCDCSAGFHAAAAQSYKNEAIFNESQEGVILLCDPTNLFLFKSRSLDSLNIYLNLIFHIPSEIQLGNLNQTTTSTEWPMKYLLHAVISSF